MSNRFSKVAVLTLPATAMALWVAEVSGQLSDGRWENTVPHSHWEFWHRLELRVGNGPVGSIVRHEGCWERPQRTGYDIIGLMNLKWDPTDAFQGYILRDRMLAYGRMAKAGADPLDRSLINAGENMPATFEAWQAIVDGLDTETVKADYVLERLRKVTPELAKAFYAATYTEKDLRADLQLIKGTMKLAKEW